MYERVHVPTDGSEAVELAVEHAIDIAKTYGAELHVLYVVDTASLSAEVNTATLIEDLEAEGEKATQAVAEQAERAGVETVTEVVNGIPHEAIVNYADDHAADLVVMGTHGRTGLDRYLIGSVTEKVVRTSDVPVLTVRLEE